MKTYFKQATFDIMAGGDDLLLRNGQVAYMHGLGDGTDGLSFDRKLLLTRAWWSLHTSSIPSTNMFARYDVFKNGLDVPDLIYENAKDLTFNGGLPLWKQGNDVHNEVIEVGDFIIIKVWLDDPQSCVVDNIRVHLEGAYI